ncbi:MAG: bifunctional UDP-N-acetylmuramoyl-tripeptide:D-alanyl-D-alanine ligase/alanine racemase [Bacteroidales bacterium]|nr:bifunctional UDP-N-acetylmuramoyl-tripeptide:D-alanyl-D-alanine ligase/alanine racemase [Bacteroidales bacterium]
MSAYVYTARKIAEITHGKLFPGNDVDAAIHHLLIDSRKPVSIQADVFFAIVTQRNDGHKYIPELIEKGIRNFVISSEPKPEWLQSNASFVLVNDTLDALQALAAHRRGLFNIPVIGITGSNGKTIVKEWLWQLMGNDRHVVRNPKSYNSQIGVPLSVWQMDEGHELGVFEAGISLPGEMEKLEKIIQPTLGIFTNLGPAHDENFESGLQKASEKLELFRNCNELICCADQKQIIEAYDSLQWSRKPRLITWSRQNIANLQILSCEKQESGTHIKAVYNNSEIAINVPFTDEASVENAIHCWLTLLHFGFAIEIIAERMLQLHPVAMRLTLKEGINNCSLVDDSYSSDLSSLGIALDFLQQQNQHRRKTVILSDMLQSGRNEADLYAEIAQLINNKNPNRFIGVGPAMMRQQDKFKGNAAFFASTKTLSEALPALDFRDESMLIKGARVFGFERIIQALQQKTHETVLEVNLDALLHNLNFYRSKLRPGVKTIAMVKAFSYGSGSFEIANVLQFHRADYLAVANADEGVELRKAGIRLPIMVMNPEEQGYEWIFKFNLEPEIYNLRTLSLLEQANERFGKPLDAHLKIHIKLDTGMHRLGFDEGDISQLISRLKDSKFEVASVFSHLAASDDPNHDGFTYQQIEAFERMCSELQTGLGYGFLKHILNTAGIARFPQAQHDMVRLGIGLYGISNLSDEQPFLEHVSTLKSIISQIRFISAGSTIGYNREFKAVKDMQIAIVPVGYADGLSRSLSNGKYSLLVHGKPAPITGNISMDMCMIDITDIPAHEGDEVIIFSPSHPITALAKAMQTIPYEVLTGISRRVKRVYFQE